MANTHLHILIPEDVKEKLIMLQKKNNYATLTDFLLDQFSLIIENGTIDLHDSKIGKDMLLIDKKLELLLELQQMEQKERLEIVNNTNSIYEDVRDVKEVIYDSSI